MATPKQSPVYRPKSGLGSFGSGSSYAPGGGQFGRGPQITRKNPTQKWIVVGILAGLGLFFLMVVAGIALYFLVPSPVDVSRLGELERKLVLNPILVREVGVVYSIQETREIFNEMDLPVKRYRVRGKKATGTVFVMFQKREDGSMNVLGATVDVPDRQSVDLGFQWNVERK